MARLRARRCSIIFCVLVLIYSSLLFVRLFLVETKPKSVASVSELKTTARPDGPKIDNSTEGTPCPVNSPFLHGRRLLDINDTSFPFNLSVQYGGEVEIGGSWRPKDCVGKKVAFLIPFRNRNKQLNVFLRTMHPVFQRQMIDYRIFVVEQAGKEKFNKGAIYNIGFNASLMFDDYDCHVFHDVDLLSEDDRNYYGCPASPMHMSLGIDKFNYKLSYPSLIGGIQLFTKEHYQHINGYSNKFWGWGGEDDNLFTRIKAKVHLFYMIPFFCSLVQLLLVLFFSFYPSSFSLY
eukprot:gene3747-15023_t